MTDLAAKQQEASLMLSKPLDVLRLSDDERKELFAKDGAIERVLSDIEQSVAIDADVSTPKGRQEIASVAYRVSRQKAALDAAGKELGDIHRRKLDAINVQRREVRDRLEALHDKIRFPLDQWEKDELDRKERLEHRLARLRQAADLPLGATSRDIQERLDELPALLGNEPWEEFEENAKQASEDTLKRLNAALEVAETREAEQAELDRLRRDREERERLDREEAERRRRAAEEQERKEREEAAARAAAEKARKEAEEKAAREAEEREAARQQELTAAKAAQEKAERAAEEARQHAQRAAAEERDRIELEARRKREAEEAEEARRLADETHRKKVRTAATAALAHRIGDERAHTAMAAIESGEIPHVTLNF